MIAAGVIILKPPPNERAARVQRLLETALGFTLIPFAIYSLRFDPIRVIEWCVD